MATYSIRWLKNILGTKFFPITHVKAVRNDNNVNLETLLDGKQQTLVSGSNIKTINGESVLGSGNISVSGGGGGGDVNVIESISVNGTAQAVDANKNVDIDVPTKVSDLTNDSGFITGYTETDPIFSASAAAGITSSDITNWNGKTSNIGTITSVKMNGTTVSSSGEADLGTVITSHQDISGKADKSATVSTVTYDTTNKKIRKTINGTTTDVVTAATIVTDGGGITSETDPTVPSWAKASSKPSYTASEVGAVPTTRKVNGKALSADITLSASDVSALPSSTVIPDELSDLSDDATHRLVTDTEKSTWNSKQSALTFDGTYNASSNKAATVSTVTNAINALDGGTIGTGGAGKTITSLSQSNGNVSATFSDISITKSQVSDFPTSMTPSAHNQASNTINAMTGYSKGSSSAAVAATDSLNTAISKLENQIDTKTSNTGTITGVSVNGTSVATSGVANITSVPASILSGAIANGVTATTQSSGDNSTKVATTAYVDTAVSNLPEPMIFKGSLGTGGTITSLPTASSSNEGYTYKVITAGTYASQAAKVGDTFISDGSAWVLIPSGDEPSGTVTSVTIKATSPIAIDNNAAITTSGERTLSHANSGVTAGTYKSVTVNATGHVTAGTNPTTLSGYGITDAKISNGTITLGSNTITPLTSFTESDPVFAASAAHGISSSDISNWNSKTSNVGTITGINMNGASKGTSGVVDLGTVITAHQDISGKADKATTLAGYGITDAHTKTEDYGKFYALSGGTSLNYSASNPVDLNTIVTPGSYFGNTTTEIEYCTNRPTNRSAAFRLWVSEPTGTVGSSYIRQRFQYYDQEEIYERYITDSWRNWVLVQNDLNGYYALTGGSELDASSSSTIDLDDFTSPGNYYTSTTSATEYVLNRPVTETTQFRLWIYKVNNAVHQRYQQMNSFVIYERMYTWSLWGYSWGSWYVVEDKLDQYLPLSGGTMTGIINFVSTDAKIGITTSGNDNIDVGWDWDTRAGAGLALRKVGASSKPGSFILWARNASNSYTLEGNPANGALTWGGDLTVNKVYVGTGGANGDSCVQSDSATNIYLRNSSGAVLVVDGKVVRRSILSSMADCTVGSSTYPWGGMYANTFYGALSGNATTATTLQTSRSIWGQSFNGSSYVRGTLSMFPDTLGMNNDTAKLWFRANTTDSGDGYSPYIQGIYQATTGRKRLSVFQINNANYTGTHSEVFTILPNGRVGVGTVEPNTLLHVNGVVTCTSVTQTSDESKKEKVEDISISVEKIAEAPNFTFKWKDDEEDKELHGGTTAQYWETLAPYYVHGDECKTLEYSTLAMSCSIELAKEIVTLKEENTQLKKELGEIKEIIHSLNK